MDAIYIANGLLENLRAEKNREIRLSKSAEAAILKYGWPGNIRELKNRLMRAVMLCSGGEITETDLELGEGAEARILPLEEAKNAFIKQYIQEILALNSGNKTKAAKDLGVDPRTIYRHLDEEE
jgi:DNA-binding NtrC family response regulator